MATKVYAVYSIPKSPDYRLEKMFKTKEGAKNYIKQKKISEIDMLRDLIGDKLASVYIDKTIYDIQIEEISE